MITQTPRLVFAAFALIGFVSTDVLAATTNWINNSGGSSTAAGNWDNGVPDGNDTAVFRRGNIPQYNVTFVNPVPFPLGSAIHPTINRLIIGTNTVNLLSIHPSTLTVDEFGFVVPIGGDTIIGQTATDVAVLNINLASLTTLGATLGSAVGSSGTLNINNVRAFNVNGTSTAGREPVRGLNVGAGGTGVVNVTGGADVTVADDTVLGRNSTGVGTVTVNGNGSTWTNTGDLTVGNQGAGTVNVESSGAMNVTGQLDIGVSGVGVMTVDAATSSISGFFHIGGSNVAGADGNGTLNVRNGANVTSLNFTDIGRSVDSTGLVRVESGSMWNTGSLTVGEQSDGTLEVTGGARVSSNAASDIGRIAGSIGTATVEGNNSRWTITGSFDVGREGEGTLQITGGGRVVMNGAAGTTSSIGRFSTSVGEVTVSSARWDNSRDLFIGDQGTGTLTITQGQVTNLVARLGNNSADSNKAGSATVSGIGALWNNADLFVGNASTGTLLIEAGGVATSLNGTVGAGAASVGTATVTGTDGQGNASSWNNSGDLTIASFSKDAALFIEAGGIVTNTNGYIGREAESIGEATVTGGDSTWTNSLNLTVGAAGMGTLMVQQGGSVSSVDGVIGNLADSIGRVTVTGMGSTWENSGELTVANASKDSQEVDLLIEAGGLVTNTNGYIGRLADSVGEATVIGGGSTWTNNMNLTVGAAGMGTLNIRDGGTVSNVNGLIGGMDGNGIVTVTGNDSTWTTDNELHVGDGAMGVGTLTIEAGGSVSDETGSIAFDADATGTVTVTSMGSTWTHGDFLRVGDSGEGTLTIAAGGSVSSVGNGFVGAGTASEGTATVTGAGSTWTSGGDLYVANGNMATGTLTIQSGGSVSNANGSVAHNQGADGTVTVTDATWTNSMDLVVGNEDMSIGRLNIQAGGSVSNFSGNIGNNAGSDGTVNVTGPNAVWTNNGSLRVGNFGTGTLLVEAGGAVSNPNSSIAAEANSTGTATITGANSTWTTTGRLAVGGNADTATNGGTGTLRIQAGAVVSVGQDILLFPNGLVEFEGGTLSTPAVSVQAGGQFEWTGGTLHVGTFTGNLVNEGGTLAPGQSVGSTAVVGNYTQQSAGTLQIEIGGRLVNAEHDFVNVTGNANLGGDLELSLINDFIPAPTDTYTIFNAGTILNFFSNVTDGQRLAMTDGLGSFIVHYGPTSTFNPNQIVLTNFAIAVLPGDFNGDGHVDAADYVVWRKTDGTPAGYDLWRANFGRTAATGSVAAGSAVPEPTTLIWASAGLAIGMTLRCGTAVDQFKTAFSRNWAWRSYRQYRR